MGLRDLSQEVKELGFRGAAFRAGWELQGRLGIPRVRANADVDGRPYTSDAGTRDVDWARNLTFGDPPSVRTGLSPLIDSVDLDRLRLRATAALAGSITCFSSEALTFGSPIQWHVHPKSGQAWDRNRDLTFAIGGDSVEGDVKLSWELGRFPHAYLIARAAAFFPEFSDVFADGLLKQLQDFVDQNPFGLGVHWTSGQEIGFRLLAWLYAHDVLLSRSAHAAKAERLISRALLEGATWIEAHLDYSRIAVYNNHLLSEALALLGVGALLPLCTQGPHWRKLGRRILEEESERQFYDDGSYIQQSHNYHRVAIQDLLWACAFTRSMGDRPSDIWLKAITRSLDFLVSHQNSVSGILPNYGANDGSLPSLLSTCEFADFRPTLQAASLLVRGERIYPAGPWDEEAAWWLGTMALDAPLNPPQRRSASFQTSGYHVLRGAQEHSFAAFRCGSLRDRFSQIDMLNVDITWRGINVITDPGSFQYNGNPVWHNHFMRTESHNTVVIDGRDQMLHYRQFKVLYWTQASLLQMQDHSHWALVEGEHYGYRRHPGQCVHKRAVLFLKDDVWIVVDSICGEGRHIARLHWLGGVSDWTEQPQQNGWTLRTSQGDFEMRVFDSNGEALKGDTVAGQTSPPRGWLSRHYGEKVAVPSFAATRQGEMPITFVTVFSGLPVQVVRTAEDWSVQSSKISAQFHITDGRISGLLVS